LVMERRKFQEGGAVRVLYSFPHKLGASRICHTAWQHVNGANQAGVSMLVCPGVLHKPLPVGVQVWPTLARGKLRIPYRLLGKMRACALHDFIVSRRLEGLARQIDIVHTWPVGALRTLKTAARLGIPSVVERPNAHTRFAYEVVKRECDRIGVPLPPDHEHAFNARVLQKEEEEYRWAHRILCPSDFVLQTFTDKGFAKEKLVRHQYGFDERAFFPGKQQSNAGTGLRMLFVGGCAPRKGVHYALDAWLRSSAHESGTFLIAGAFVPGYAEKLQTQLSHPSVQPLGHRNDVADLMRQSDVLVLPTIEEGSALVTSEARGSGCVLLVSEAAGAYCQHGKDALIHRAGDVSTLAEQISLLDQDRSVLRELRRKSLMTVGEISWRAAGTILRGRYEEIVAGYARSVEAPRSELAAAVA
jgi:glycosyltransferase involved in cell wall biosynthesis